MTPDRRQMMHWCAAVCVLALAARPLAAQRIFGTVVLADDRTPAPGTIVYVTDSVGAVVARDLASARGDYVLPLAGSGSFTLTARRVGSAPEIVRAITVPDVRDIRVRVVLAHPIAPPAAVASRSRETCDVLTATGDVPVLWEQLQVALATTAMAEQTRLFVGTWEMSEVVLDGNLRDTLSRSTSTERMGLEVPVMPTIPADSSLRRGYVIESADRVMYHAPSVATLRSDAFTTRRCFALEPAPASTPGVIGVHFRPDGARTGMSDIEGNVWFSATTLEPQRLDYRYTGLPATFAPAQAGGSLTFRRLQTGHWVTDDWTIRVPSGRYFRLFAYDTRGVPSGAGNFTLDGVRATTMRLRELQAGGSTIYRRPQ